MKIQALFLAVIFLVAPFIWLMPARYAGRLMMISTVIVYAIVSPLALSLLLGVSLLQWLTWHSETKYGWPAAKWLPVVIPVLPLLFYKILFTYDNWLIPLGLSYYAFRQIHVAFEYYKGTLKRVDLWEFLQYLLFLPVILVGPIHRMPEFQRSLRRHKWNPLMISEGLERILYGLVKISFLGNFICSVWLKQIAGGIAAFYPRLYLEVVSFTANAYFQFAGFSDLAIGGGLLWGIRVMENFKAPFLATNMQNFWHRWHISLSEWCRDYVFHPVAAFTRNRWAAVIVSMMVLALWHEISIRYLLWGALQGAFILLTVRSRKMLPYLENFININPVVKWIGRCWVFHLFAFSCILIGYDSMPSIEPYIKKLLG
jgi:alginate O-acetyltransferase complex protein AlgI